MPEGSFGERLSSARRKRGLSVSQVSGALRIRQSIIEALESSDFENMPLKGYARNMTSSYARYLGLDPALITEMFLREYQLYESHGSRRTKSNSGDNYDPTVSKRSEKGGINNSEMERQLIAKGQTGDMRQMPADNYGSPQRKTVHLSQRNTSAQTFWGEGDKPRRIAVDASRKSGRSSRENQPKTVSRGIPVDNRGYSGKGKRGAFSFIGGLFSKIAQALIGRPLVMVIGLVILLIAILIAIAFFAGTCSRRDVDVLTVTGGASSSDGISASDLGANLEDIAKQQEENAKYGPFELNIEIVEGASWLVVTVDGEQKYADIADVGFAEKYNVTASAQIEAGAPGYVKVYRNQQPVEMGIEGGLGILELKVEQKPETSNANTTTPNANATGTSANSDSADLAAATAASATAGTGTDATGNNTNTTSQ